MKELLNEKGVVTEGGCLIVREDSSTAGYALYCRIGQEDRGADRHPDSEAEWIEKEAWDSYSLKVNNHKAKQAHTRTSRHGAAGLSKTMTDDANLISYLVLLRFGADGKAKLSHPILNYTSIAKLVKKPV